MYAVEVKVLITGASGYLGQYLVQHYLSAGAHVLGIDKLQSSISDPKYQHKQHELSTNDNYVEGLIGEFLPSLVIHSAALVPLTKDYSHFKSTNALLPSSLYSICDDYGIPHFIHISSSAVFTPDSDGSVRYGAPLSPVEPYGRSKAQAENLLIEASSVRKTKLAIVRPRTIVGGFRGGIMSLLFSWLDRGLPLFLVGRKDQPFQFIEVNDLVNAISTIDSLGMQGAFNVGATNYGSLRDLYTELIEQTGSPSRIRRIPSVGVPTILGVMEKLRLSPLAPYHYHTYSRGFFFDRSGLEDTNWLPLKSNEAMFLEAWNQRNSTQVGSSDSEHRSTLKWKLLDAFLKVVK